MPNGLTGLLLFGATPALEPERPLEPWPKGVHPTLAEWEKTRSYQHRQEEEGENEVESSRFSA